MGVDPGTLITGYGVIDCDGGKLTLVDYGVIRMKSTDTLPVRLGKIHVGLLEVVDRTAPDEFSIESAFYSKNVQSTLKLGHARGVAILAAVLRQIPTSEYAPREIKRAVTGNGNASKEQVEYMVMAMLKIENPHQYFDATDALATALCHSSKLQRPRANVRNWSQFVKENPDRIAL